MPTRPPPSQSAERRDFFRIEDRVGLEYRRLSAAPDEAPDPFDDGQLDGLRTELRRLDQEVRSQLSVLAERDRLLTTVIKSLNGKLDTLARIMAFEQNPLQPQDWRSVTLSEGGIAFETTDPGLAAGDDLALRLTLPPELYRPRACGRIIDLATSEAGARRVHVEFTSIQEGDRQQIAKHIMRWQIRQRQQHRDPQS